MYPPSTMRGTDMVKQTILHGNGETDIPGNHDNLT
jgi:hypothetical protein